MAKRSGEVIGFLHDQRELNRCIAELREANFAVADISTYISNSEDQSSMKLRKDRTATIGSGFAGAGIGAALGSMLGFLFGSGYLDFFNPDSSRSMSPYFSVMVGAAVGAAFGGVGGAIMGHKLPDDNEGYENLAPDEIRVAVRATDQAQVQLAKFILAEFGGTRITFRLHQEPAELIYKEKSKVQKKSKQHSKLDQH